MAVLRWRKKLLTAKIEATAGTEIATAAADAVLAIDVELTPLAGETVGRDLERAYYGAAGSLPVNAHQTLAFSVELAGSGTDATAPAWGKLMQACGMKEDTTPANSVKYTPVTGGTDDKTITLDLNIDGQIHTLYGARGTWTISLAPNQIPRIRFEFTGLYKDPSSEAAITSPVYTGWKAPVVPSNAKTPVFKLHAKTDLGLTALEIALGNEIAYREIIGADSEVIITGRNTTGSVTIDAPGVSSGGSEQYALVKAAKEGTLNNFEIVHGGTVGTAGDDGKRVKISAPKVQLGPPSYQDADGVWQMQVPLTFTPDSGNDEIEIETS